MSALQPFLLVSTVFLVGTCSRVCAGAYRRHRAALPGDDMMQRLRSAMEPRDPAERIATESAVAELPLEERVFHEVLAAPNRPTAVLALNELTAEIKRALQDARTLPTAVGRVALLGGTALGLTAIATALQGGQGSTAAVWGGACLMLGVLGAGICGVYGRLARQAAERRRDRAQELIRLLERRLPTT